MAPAGATPFQLLMDGEWAAAATRWAELGRRYTRLGALAEGDRPAAVEALAVLAELGAVRAARHLQTWLRRRGMTAVPRGPRPSTAANAAGLTARQLEVLALLAEGLSDAAIATRLTVSHRTVEHHVAAVGAALRFSLAALVLIALMAALRLSVPRGRALAGAALYGALNFGIAFALVYFALVRLHGGIGQTLVSVVPLATLLLAAAWGQERLAVAALASTVPAMAGVALLSWQALDGPIPLVYLLALLGGALRIGQAAVVVRAFPPVHPVTMNAVGMTVGAALLLALSALRGDHWTLPKQAETRFRACLSGTRWLRRGISALHGRPATLDGVPYVVPDGADPLHHLVLSAWLDNEPIGIGLLVGGPLILAGVYLGAIRPARTTALLEARRNGNPGIWDGRANGPVARWSGHLPMPCPMP